MDTTGNRHNFSANDFPIDVEDNVIFFKI